MAGWQPQFSNSRNCHINLLLRQPGAFVPKDLCCWSVSQATRAFPVDWECLMFCHRPSVIKTRRAWMSPILEATAMQLMVPSLSPWGTFEMLNVLSFIAEKWAWKGDMADSQTQTEFRPLRGCSPCHLAAHRWLRFTLQLVRSAVVLGTDIFYMWHEGGTACSRRERRCGRRTFSASPCISRGMFWIQTIRANTI